MRGPRLSSAGVRIGGGPRVSVAGRVWTPRDLTGIVAWYHADDLTGSAGEMIATWPARVGPNATQSTAGSRPTIGTLATGAKAAAVSDGAKWLRIESPLIAQSTTAVTVLMVYQITAVGASAPAKYLVSVANGSPISTQKSLAVMARDGAGALAVGGYGQTTARGWTATLNAEHGIFGQDATGPYAWRGGVAQTMVGGGALYNPTAVPTGPSAIGAVMYGAASYYGAPAKIREVVITTAKPTVAEVEKWAAWTLRNSGI